mmetsp:Transcript_17446/g.45579  ORF Transcript_17446/g.45579 Transcript_17446/m.45579 type:complete len:416 (+) Transcript_17446:73-1320(+)
MGCCSSQPADEEGSTAAKAPVQQPGFHKCFFLGSVRVDQPTCEASERAFATIIKTIKEREHPPCIVRATVHGVAAKRYPDRTPLFDIAIFDIDVITCVGRAMVIISKDAGGPDAPHTAYSYLTGSNDEARTVAIRLAQVRRTVNMILTDIADKRKPVDAKPSASDPGGGSTARDAAPAASPIAKPNATNNVPPSEAGNVNADYAEATMGTTAAAAVGVNVKPSQPQVYDTAAATNDLPAEHKYDTARSAISLEPVEATTYATAGRSGVIAVAPARQQAVLYEAASATVLEEDAADVATLEKEADFVDEPDDDEYLDMLTTSKATHFPPTSGPDEYVTLKLDAKTLGKPPPPPAFTRLDEVLQTVPLYSTPTPIDEPTSADFAEMEAGVKPPTAAFIRKMSMAARRTKEGYLTFGS